MIAVGNSFSIEVAVRCHIVVHSIAICRFVRRRCFGRCDTDVREVILGDSERRLNIELIS